MDAISYQKIRQLNRRPVIYSQDDIAELLEKLKYPYSLIGGLLYGAGLRLRDCLRLRVQDIDFAAHAITLRDHRGYVRHSTLLPLQVREALVCHQTEVQKRHQTDLDAGFGEVYLPHGIIGDACGFDWEWQYVFPSPRRSLCAAGGTGRRHHLSETTVRKAFDEAIRQCNLPIAGTSNVFRDSFAVHLLQEGHDIHTVHHLLDHKSIETTMVYMQFVETEQLTLVSPLDFE